MASMVDHHHQAMLSAASMPDFDLFPNHHEAASISDLLAQGPNDLSAAPRFTSMTFDSYPAMTAPPQHTPTFYDASAFKHRASPVSAHSFENPPSNHSASSASLPSASSSTIGSPYSSASQSNHAIEAWTDAANVLTHDGFGQDFLPAGLDQDLLYPTADKMPNTFVDPSLISPFPIQTTQPPSHTFTSPSVALYQPSSPAHSHNSSHSQIHIKAGSQSPFLHAAPYHPYQNFNTGRRPSVASVHSRLSASPRSATFDGDEEPTEKNRCPDPSCGKIFKDIKAHMLTHQSERPEKCPIVTCEYHLKGFARKYDKNRHTLTHYKGNMVCGFCPGSGSPTEKSFNRADVFKRHLTQVHGVEQTPPNSRKKPSSTTPNKKLMGYAADATGKCSTCSATFSNAQDFYEHLDDCVLRMVQQEDPSEAINEKQLSALDNDDEVEATLKSHSLSADDWIAPPAGGYNSEDDDEASGDDDESSDRKARSGKGGIKRSVSDPAKQSGKVNHGGISKPSRNGRPGMTYSKGGVALVGKGAKKRKNFPISWGCAPDKMKMKKRGLYVYDGPRRLWKDDLMLDKEFEVRVRYGDGKNYVTDLDIKTLERAEAFHNATAEEKGPWESPQQCLPEVDIEELMK